MCKHKMSHTHIDHRQLVQLADEAVQTKHQEVREDPHRQAYHIMPPAFFMNDPNGVVYYKGEYHVFFQHLPFSINEGEKVWGHVKSKDLVHWEYLPIAIVPSQPGDENGCFSGSAVDDNGILTLIYTGYILERGDRRELQLQNIATSEDGIHFTKYEGNPVIGEAPADGTPADGSPPDFRDPKVWRHEGTWYMVIGSSREGRGQILLYSSPDLRDWTYRGVAAQSDGTQGQIWECPDLFPLGDGKHVLVVSCLYKEDGALRGYRNWYMVGVMDYAQGRFIPESCHETDCGADFFAAQTFEDDKGRRILFAWMDWYGANWVTANNGWAGSLTLPRVLSLLPDGQVAFQPAEELALLRGQHVGYGELDITADSTGRWLGDTQGDSLEILAIFRFDSPAEVVLQVRASEDRQEETLVVYNSGHHELTIDRDKSGNGVTGVSRCTLKPMADGLVKLHIFVDRSSIEVFGNDGRVAVSNRIYPQPGSTRLDLYARSGTAKLLALDVWKLESGGL